MRITYDSEADAMYIYFSEKPVEKTVRVSSRVMVDLDADENVRGIEMLFVSKSFAGTDFSNIHLELPRVRKIDLHLPSAV